MKNRITAAVFRIIRFLVRVFYPRTEFEGKEKLPDGAFIAVGNHAKMNAPIACELYFPVSHFTWTAGEMMHLREVPDYSYRDFWGRKPGYIKWFFRLLSYLIAPLAVCIFNNARCIGVYRDQRIIKTFRDTVRCLEEGSAVVILPEHDVPYNGLVWEFQDRFVDVAKMYYKRTKKDIAFVPMYVAPALKKVVFGEPVYYDHTASAADERSRISRTMMDAVTRLAEELPEHTVIPYPNIPKKDYPSSRDVREPEKRAGVRAQGGPESHPDGSPAVVNG